MTVIYLTQAVNDKRLNGVEKRMLKASIANSKLGACDLAKLTGIDKSGGCAAMRKLIALGFVAKCDDGFKLTLPGSEAPNPVLGLYQSTISIAAKALYGYFDALKASGVYYVTVDRVGRAMMLSEANVTSAIAELAELSVECTLETVLEAA